MSNLQGLPSLQGLQTYFVHDPDKTFDTMQQMAGQPRIHKFLVHDQAQAKPPAFKADWVARAPKNCLAEIRDLDFSINTDFSTTAGALAAAAQAHELTMSYIASAESQGVSRDRLIMGLTICEYDGHPSYNPALLAVFECERLRLAVRDNVPHLALGDLGSGWPGTLQSNPQAAADYGPFDPIFDAMRKDDMSKPSTLYTDPAQPCDVWSEHRYYDVTGPNALFSNGDMQWPVLAGRGLMCPRQDIRILVSEEGMTLAVHGGPDTGWAEDLTGTTDQKVAQAIAMSTWTEAHLATDPRVVGIQKFLNDYEKNNWASFDVSQDPMRTAYIQFCQAGVTPYVWTGVRQIDQWANIIQYRAGLAKLDARIIASIMWLESRGNTWACNTDSQATGLMQVLPGEVMPGRPLQIVLYNPDQNVKAGVADLQTKLAGAGGDLATALAHYGGADSPTDCGGQVYLAAFEAAWGTLFPGQACPLDLPAPVTPVGPLPADAETKLLICAFASQAIQLNPDAAIQKAIAATQAFWPTGPEVSNVLIDGQTFTYQRAEHPVTGEVRVYFCRNENWSDVEYIVRPAGG